MTDHPLNTLRGYYWPSFIQMKVNGDCDLSNLNFVPEQHYSTFFHEYVHFLQDMTTTFGMVNVNIIGNRLRYYVEEASHSPLSSFTVAMTIPPSDITSINKDLQIVYLGKVLAAAGNMAAKKVIINDVQLLNSAVFLPSPHSKYLEYVVVDFSYEGNNHKIEFGALCILESMAHLIQQKFHPTVNHPAFPYHSAELIAKNIYAVIGNNPEFVFALCDTCLMENHPGKAFYKVLHLMKREGFTPTDGREIYDFVNRKVSGPSGESLTDVFVWQSQNAEALYDDLFASSIFSNEKQWVKSIIQTGRLIRVTDPYFMLSLYQQTTSQSPLFVSLMEQLGTPLMFNAHDDAWFCAPKAVRSLNIMPDRLAAILEMFLLFDRGKKHCELKGFCVMNINVDSRCTNAPWLRSSDSKLCAYGQFWKTWNLLGKYPI